MDHTTTHTPTIAILGATSAVALAYARKLLTRGPIRFVLVGRNEANLNSVKEDLVARGADPQSAILEGPLGRAGDVPDLFNDMVETHGPIDEACLAYGVLDIDASTGDKLHQLGALIETNFTSAALWIEAFMDHFKSQGKGQMMVLGSVAGDRGRQSNYLYGATKSALERLVEGQAHAHAANKAIHITLIKPGFIDSPMTAHIENKGGPLWSTPEQIADVMLKARDKQRVRVYAPWFWRYILLAVRALPVSVMHRTKL